MVWKRLLVFIACMLVLPLGQVSGTGDVDEVSECKRFPPPDYELLPYGTKVDPIRMTSGLHALHLAYYIQGGWTDKEQFFVSLRAANPVISDADLGEYPDFDLVAEVPGPDIVMNELGRDQGVIPRFSALYVYMPIGPDGHARLTTDPNAFSQLTAATAQFALEVC